MSEFRFEDDRNPRLGDDARIAYYCTHNWGIGKDPAKSLEAYTVEWSGGGKRQMDYVIGASKRAGLGDYPNKLRKHTARLVAAAVRKYPGRVNILETGAGASTVVTFNEIDDNDKERVYLIGIEPSEKRCQDAIDDLEDMGIREGKNFKMYETTDEDIPKLVIPGSQQIIYDVAMFHHKAHPLKDYRNRKDALVSGGLLISGDWHNSKWEHPSRVLKLVKRLPFTTERDIEKFIKMYPKAIEPFPETDPLIVAANIDIGKFWDSYADIKQAAKAKGEFSKKDDIFMLEAHRPNKLCVKELEESGFIVDIYAAQLIKELYEELGFDENPHLIVPGNDIISIIAALNP